MSDYSEEDKNIMKRAFLAKNKSRLQELIDFVTLSGFKKLGIANCKSMQQYADQLMKFLEEQGFVVKAVNCKESGLQGETLCQEMTGPCCDPISQALFLNEAQTDLNINVGLCLGHGLLFQKYSKAPVTTFVVKDVLTGHKTIENLQ